MQKLPALPKVVNCSIGGGGAAITYLAGAAAAVSDCCVVNHWSGTSAGAIIAAGHAFSVPNKQILNALQEIFGGSIIKLSADAFGRGGILDWNTIGNAIDRIIGKGARMEDAFTGLVITATNLDRREPFYFSKMTTPRVLVREALMASSAFMGGVTPACTVPSLGTTLSPDIRLFSDGGYVDNTCDHAWDYKHEQRIMIRLKPDHEVRRVRPGDVIGIHKAVISSLFHASNEEKSKRTDGITMDIPFANDWDFTKNPTQVEEEYSRGYGAAIYSTKENGK